MDEPANPYAAPEIPPIVSVVASPEDWEARQLEAFVGAKAYYYLAKWAPVRRGWGGSAGFNWAAFLLSGLWLPYRKMYKVTFIFFGIIILESILEDVLFLGILGQAETPLALDNAIGLLAAAICGAFGNRWYLSHARRVVSQVSATGLQGDALLYTLAQRGGTSLLASVGMFVLFIVAISLIYVPLEMFLYEY